ncbi:MAG: hypothetical protein WAT71_04675 [Ignavibacteria bacterium]
MYKAKFIIIYIFLFTIISLTIINCSDDPVSVVDTSDFRYPFTDGSYWNYKRTITISDIRPDSILHYFLNNPTVITGTVTILYDTVINSVVTKCFLDEFTSEGMTRSNRYYYLNNDTALILYSSRTQPANGLFPLSIIRKSNIISSDFIGNFNLNSVEIVNSGESLSSTLKYPIVTGTEWTSTNGGAEITRNYLGFENVTTPSVTTSCMKEKTTYNFFPNDPVYNYYSKFGLMKRTQFVNDIEFSTITYPTGIGIIDINDESEILSYRIASN